MRNLHPSHTSGGKPLALGLITAAALPACWGVPSHMSMVRLPVSHSATWLNRHALEGCHHASGRTSNSLLFMMHNIQMQNTGKEALHDWTGRLCKAAQQHHADLPPLKNSERAVSISGQLCCAAC